MTVSDREEVMRLVGALLEETFMPAVIETLRDEVRGLVHSAMQKALRGTVGDELREHVRADVQRMVFVEVKVAP